MNKQDETKLDSFQFQYLKRINKIIWSNIIPIEDLNDLTQVQRISVEVKRKKMELDWPHTEQREQSPLHDCLEKLEGQKQFGQKLFT